MDNQLLLSLRSYKGKMSAAELMKRLVRHIGEGGGHRTKAGGAIPPTGTPGEGDRLRSTIRRRYFRALGIKSARQQRLIPRADANPPAQPKTSMKRDDSAAAP